MNFILKEIRDSFFLIYMLEFWYLLKRSSYDRNILSL